jgi:digeranylgeranylglycerophospholipid reductase
MTRADIVVVGLGPAGACAARAAAQMGARVVAVDRRRRPGIPVQCAELVARGLELEIGALDSVTRQFVGRMTTAIEDGPACETEEFRGRMIDRAGFDRMLGDAAGRAGADCRFGIACRKLDRDGLHLADGNILTAPVMVAADGSGSIIGRAAGIANRALIETRQITVPVQREKDATRVFLTARLPGGYGWLFPAGGQARLGVGAASGAAARLRLELDALRSRLLRAGWIGREVAALTGGAIPCGGIVGPVGRVGDMTVLAAGDAAGLANPVSGAGIAAAVMSGRLAGIAAARVAAGRPAAADDYADEIEAVFGASLRRALARLAVRPNAAGDAAAWRRSWIGFPEYWH